MHSLAINTSTSLPPIHPDTITKSQQLQRWHMLLDDTPQQTTYCCADSLHNQHLVLSEALIPNIRLLACLIAAPRLDWQQPTPAIITETADWFAARILLLNVRIFHLDLSLIPMLKTANQRAKTFAQNHQLPFTTAQMHISLPTASRKSILLIETETHNNDKGIIANSLILARQTDALMAAWL